MANPVLTGVSPSGTVVVNAGQTVEVTASGTDADARTETFSIQLKDKSGNLSNEVPVTFDFPDPLEVVVSQPEGSIGVVVLDPTNKMKFTVRNPN